MKVALVTGTRRETRRGVITNALTKFDPDIVIHGACPTGVDAEADQWARRRRKRLIPIPALWNELGRSVAGKHRNETLVMVASQFDFPRRSGQFEGFTHDAVVCFAVPDSSSIGTLDCTRRAIEAGIRVEQL